MSNTTRWVGIVWIVIMIMMSFKSSGFAASWYDDYQNGLRAIGKQDYKTAIESFKSAIGKEPEPNARKRYGVDRTFGYYPYLYLGLSYLASGDIEAAHYYCDQAKQKGAAPEKELEKCLTITSQYVKFTPTPMLLPTSVPTLTPAPQPDSLPPVIQLLSNPPTETAQDSLNLQGFVTDDQGVELITIQREHLGLAWTFTQNTLNRQIEAFENPFILEPGRNTFMIAARDTTGQVSQKTFTVIRTQSVAGVAPTPIPQVPIPVPTPIPQPPRPMPTSTPRPPVAVPTAMPRPLSATPTPLTDTPPVITLISQAPKTTEQETLTIQGVATDDHGIAHVTVNLRKPGAKSLDIFTASMVQENFQADIPLELGQNEIVIEATDSAGQIGKHSLMITRTVSVKPQIDSVQPSATPGTLPRQGNLYAVIIGIGKYRDAKIPSLNYTVNDAQGLYDVLINPNYGGIPKDNIQLLLDQEATVANIKKAIGTWLRQQAKEDDTVMIYYSGHGAPEGKETYWVTYDADIEDLYATALSNNTIAELFDRIRSQRVITFLDSCYSAATVNRTKQTRDLLQDNLWEKFSGSGRVTISASDGKQLSLELDEYRHGVFTYYLLEGLQGQADKDRDGVIDVDEIWNYVKYQVREVSRSKGNLQDPMFQGSLTAGIPLTFDLETLRAKQAEYVLQRKLDTLKTLFTQQRISAPHYNCAFKMLMSGESDPFLAGLLSGTIDPVVFRESFTCKP